MKNNVASRWGTRDTVGDHLRTLMRAFPNCAEPFRQRAARFNEAKLAEFGEHCLEHLISQCGAT